MSDNNQQYVPEFLVFNTQAIRPVEVTFQMDCKTLKEIIHKIASELISGVEDVTLQHNKNGDVGLFLWFNANSDHFNDSSTLESALRTKLSRLSKEMTDFISKFGWNEADDDPRNGNPKIHSNKIIISNDNPEVRGKWIAVHVAINPFLFIIFDIQGNAYKKQFNRNAPKATMRREWCWGKGPTGKFHSLNGIRVTKKIHNPALSRDDLHAKWGGNFN